MSEPRYSKEFFEELKGFWSLNVNSGKLKELCLYMMSDMSSPTPFPRVTRSQLIGDSAILPRSKAKPAPLRAAKRTRHVPDPLLIRPEVQFVDQPHHAPSVEQKMDLVLEALTEMGSKVRYLENFQRQTNTLHETTAGTSLSLPVCGGRSRSFRETPEEVVASSVVSLLPSPAKVLNFQPISESMDKLMRDKRAFVQLDILLPQNYDIECSSDANTIVDTLAGAFLKLTGKGGGILKRKVDNFSS